jgi:vacuolar-type H+-ATPase subunit I/STV1
MGRNQHATIINEANMYRLVMKSRAKNALVFQEWVIEDVLPSIRKTGKYENSNVVLNSMEIMRQQLDYIIEHEKKLQEHEKKIESHEARLLDIEAKIKTTNEDYFSLAGYYALQGKTWDLSLKDEQSIGKMLSKTSQQQNMPVIKVHDSKYGEVNGYHKDILKIVLNF